MWHLLSGTVLAHATPREEFKTTLCYCPGFAWEALPRPEQERTLLSKPGTEGRGALPQAHRASEQLFPPKQGGLTRAFHGERASPKLLDPGKTRLGLHPQFNLPGSAAARAHALFILPA